MVNNYKRFIQNHFQKAKSTASAFISSKNEEQEEDPIELNTQYYVELKAIADKQNSTVEAVANGIIAQYLASVPSESTSISVDQKEDNPLLYLDGICKLVD